MFFLKNSYKRRLFFEDRYFYFISVGNIFINKGTYFLLLRNLRSQNIIVGKLGNIYFKRGYYIYVGSGWSNLLKRIGRHLSKTKKIHWHIDRLTTNEYIRPLQYQILFHNMRIENELAEELLNIGDSIIDNFGSSDTKDLSHLIYFKNNPLKNKDLLNIINGYITDES